MASFSHTLPVQATPAALWALVRDVRRLAGLFPYITIDDFTSPAPECWRFWRTLNIPNVTSLRWQEEATVTADGELSFHAVGGDLQTFTGRWCVYSDGGDGAKLKLALEYVIPDGKGPQMPAMLVNYVMGEIFRSICQRIKDAVEEHVA